MTHEGGYRAARAAKKHPWRATTLKVDCSQVAAKAAELLQCSWAMKVQILHNSASPSQDRRNQQHPTYGKEASRGQQMQPMVTLV